MPRRGRLEPDGRNAILVTHGYTSGPRMIEPGVASSEGAWSTLVGPGAPIDTDRYFVVCSNMLGSSYGSTNAASIDPRTGRPYGSAFPAITVADIVTAQKRLLDHLGVTHLRAVVGPSYGGFQAFQWAVTFPDFMDGVAPVVTSPLPPQSDRVEGLLKWFEKDPNWNGGDYYDKGGVHDTLTALRVDTLTRYGLAASLSERFPDPVAAGRRVAADRLGTGRTCSMRTRCSSWARPWRPTTSPRTIGRIRVPVLYVLSRTDALFPPSLAPGVMADLRAAGVDASLCGNRQRTWPSGIRRRCRQMGAGTARLHRQTGSCRMSLVDRRDYLPPLDPAVPADAGARRHGGGDPGCRRAGAQRDEHAAVAGLCAGRGGEGRADRTPCRRCSTPANTGHTQEVPYYPDEFFEPYLSRRRAVGWELYGKLGIARGEAAKMKAQHRRNFQFFDAPVGMIFTIDRRLATGSWLDYGMFLQNVMTAPAAVASTPARRRHGRHYHRAIRPVLGLADEETVVCGMALGYADPDAAENTLVTTRDASPDRSCGSTDSIDVCRSLALWNMERTSRSGKCLVG